MSLIIFHGEHHVNSRNALQKVIDDAKSRDVQLDRLIAKTLQFSELELLLGSQDLFAQSRLLILEELHSLPRSKRKQELIQLIGKFSTDFEIVLWEKKALTASQLNQFPQAKQQLFKLSSSLFQWLDQFGNREKNTFALFDEAVQSDGKEFCFLMLARQLRLLIAIKSGSPLPSAPFIQQKLKKQADLFTTHQLFNIHEKLTFLDFQSKIGQPIHLVHEIERLMLYS